MPFCQTDGALPPLRSRQPFCNGQADTARIAPNRHAEQEDLMASVSLLAFAPQFAGLLFFPVVRQ
jgi:hypothetical protein